MSSHPNTGRTGQAEAIGGTPNRRSGGTPGAAEPSSGNGHHGRPPSAARAEGMAAGHGTGPPSGDLPPDGAPPPDGPDATPAEDARADDASAGDTRADEARTDDRADDARAQGVSQDALRAAMARLAAGVVLVTALDPEDGPDGAPAGMTATAFLSVSLDPPLVLVSVRTGSRMDEILQRRPLWAASLLADSQRAVAGRFAMKGRLSDRLVFRQTPHTTGPITGAPLLDGALATVECRTEQRVPAGDHTLVVGRVLGTTLASDDRAPLLYQRGAYRSLG